MKEIILNDKKNGMFVLLLTILFELVMIIGFIYGGMYMDGGGSAFLFVICLLLFCVGWIPLCGLRVLKPQEALVLTLWHHQGRRLLFCKPILLRC